MMKLLNWSSLPDNVVANVLSYCTPAECINVSKADARRLLPHLVQTNSPASPEGTGPAILNRMLKTNIERVIDRSSLCAMRDGFSGERVMGVLEDLHSSMLSGDSTSTFTNSNTGTSLPFNMLIAGTYTHQATLGVTWNDDLDRNRSTRDQLDLYVTVGSASVVRTALMHKLDLVLVAASNGHLYRNNRGIQQIEHYVVMPQDGIICKDSDTNIIRSFTYTKAGADSGRNKIRVKFTKNEHDPYRQGLDSWHNRVHGERSSHCIIKTATGNNVLYEPRLSGFLSQVNMIVLRGGEDCPVESVLSGLDLECHSSVYLFGDRWSIPTPMETFFGMTRFNSSHRHDHLGRENRNRISNRVAVKYLKCLWDELNKPLDQAIAHHNSESDFSLQLPTYTIDYDGTIRLPSWYTTASMSGDRAYVLFSKALDEGGIVSNIVQRYSYFNAQRWRYIETRRQITTQRQIRAVRDTILRKVISNLSNEDCSTDLESELFRNAIIGYDPISAVQCHNGVFQSCNLERLVKCFNKGIRILNVPIEDRQVIRELPSGWSDSDYNSDSEHEETSDSDMEMESDFESL